MNRPRTFTLLSILSLVLFFGGLAASWATISGSGDYSRIPLAGLLFCYALAALANAVGLWRCQKWAALALRIWVATFLAYVLAFIYAYSSMFADSMWAIVGLLIFVAVIAILLDKHVRSKFAAMT